MARSHRWTKALAALGLITTSAGVALLATVPAAGAADDLHQNYICKFTNKPHTGEVAQGGGSPIYNDYNASTDVDGDGVIERGDWFTDGQGLSIVIVPLTPRLDPEPSTADCWALYNEIFGSDGTVTFSDPNCANGNTASYSVSGLHNAVESGVTGTVAPGETITVTLASTGEAAFDSNPDLAGVQPVFTREFTHTFAAAEDCEVPPREATPVAPTFTDPTCDVDADLELPTTEGVTYDVVGTVAPGATVTVTATAQDGYVLVGESVFEHTYADAPAGCAPITPEPPVVNPPPAGPIVPEQPQPEQPKPQNPPPAGPAAPTQVVTPTVVKAGVLDEAAAGVSPAVSESIRLVGTGLTGVGLVLLVGSGAAWLRRSGGEA